MTRTTRRLWNRIDDALWITALLLAILYLIVALTPKFSRWSHRNILPAETHSQLVYLGR